MCLAVSTRNYGHMWGTFRWTVPDEGRWGGTFSAVADQARVVINRAVGMASEEAGRAEAGIHGHVIRR
jgi:hypothetical protein